MMFLGHLAASRMAEEKRRMSAMPSTTAYSARFSAAFLRATLTIYSPDLNFPSLSSRSSLVCCNTQLTWNRYTIKQAHHLTKGNPMPFFKNFWTDVPGIKATSMSGNTASCLSDVPSGHRCIAFRVFTSFFVDVGHEMRQKRVFRR